MVSDHFKKSDAKEQVQLNVGILINLKHKKTTKAATSNWSTSSGVKFTRSGLQN